MTLIFASVWLICGGSDISFDPVNGWAVALMLVVALDLTAAAAD